MPVSAGEAEASSTAGPVVGPGDVLGHPHPGADVCVGAVGVVAVSARAVRRNRRKYGRDVLHALYEAHVVVPFVIHEEGLDAASDRVLRQLLEFAFEVRIDGPERLEVTTRPVEHVVARLALGDLDGVMEHGDSNALLG